MEIKETRLGFSSCVLFMKTTQKWASAHIKDDFVLVFFFSGKILKVAELTQFF